MATTAVYAVYFVSGDVIEFKADSCTCDDACYRFWLDGACVARFGMRQVAGWLRQ